MVQDSSPANPLHAVNDAAGKGRMLVSGLYALSELQQPWAQTVSHSLAPTTSAAGLVLKRTAVPLLALEKGYDAYQHLKINDGYGAAEQGGRFAGGIAGGMVGASLGSAAFFMAGASIGTLTVPGLGTIGLGSVSGIVGGMIGGIAGAVGGEEKVGKAIRFFLGDTVQHLLNDQLAATHHTLSARMRQLCEEAKHQQRSPEREAELIECWFKTNALSHAIEKIHPPKDDLETVNWQRAQLLQISKDRQIFQAYLKEHDGFDAAGTMQPFLSRAMHAAGLQQIHANHTASVDATRHTTTLHTAHQLEELSEGNPLGLLKRAAGKHSAQGAAALDRLLVEHTEMPISPPSVVGHQGPSRTPKHSFPNH
jgi:hypothetical protein